MVSVAVWMNRMLTPGRCRGWVQMIIHAKRQEQVSVF
jgi:hypothetical protein